MINYLKKELNRLSERKYIDKKIIEKFFRRIEKDRRLIQEENPANHFCCFFLPVHKQTRSTHSTLLRPSALRPRSLRLEEVDTERRLAQPNVSIYLVDHIKARDWIPPGGHIEKNEFPLETVKREFLEELSHKLTKEKIELFDLSVKRINKPKQVCKIHYDLWYLVYTDKIDFIFTKKEFYQAGWFSAEKGLQLIKTAKYNTIVKKLLSF